MQDKKSFGNFVAQKRKEAGLTQAEVADALYITVSAVSKWERGVSYPDITLLSDLSRILNVDERELIAAGNDGDYRKMKAEARKYRIIRSLWFWIPVSLYSVALAVCFICNLAVDKTLSWFFYVVGGICVAFSVCPTFSVFTNRYKLLTASGGFLGALIFLLIICNVLTGGNWFFTAAISLIFAYCIIFLPIFIKIYPLPGRIKRHGALLWVGIDFAVLILLLAVVLFGNARGFLNGFLISLYCFAPIFLTVTVFAYLKFNKLIKWGITCVLWGIFIFFIDPFTNAVVGDELYGFYFNLFKWNADTFEGNLAVLTLSALVISGAAFITAGLVKYFRYRKVNGKNDD